MQKVLDDWIGVCQRLNIDFQITVYDGGSTDSTLDIVRATVQVNSPGVVELKILPGVPHGPSILRGYREATTEWIFQMDSDDAFGTRAFEEPVSYTHLWTLACSASTTSSGSQVLRRV